MVHDDPPRDATQPSRSADDQAQTSVDGLDPRMTRDAHDQLQRLRVTMGFISRDDAHLEPIDGRYEVVKEVAVGGMGQVYLVRDTRFDTPDALVALKLVASKDPVLQDRLWREAHALLSLRKSKHVVPVYDVGRRGDDIYFTMRHVEGGTLRAWQVDKALPELLDAYLLAARGLSDAHACGIVHRDFKPDNVLVEGQDVLVADFGLAALVAEEPSEPPSPELALARPHVTLGGTLPYMAPEQLAGEPADAKTDQFAFCVALWEASCGCLPWTWKRRDEQLERMAQPPRAERAIPAWLRRILLRGMALERRDRFPDMTALVEALERGRGRRARFAMFGVGLLGLAAATGLGMCITYEPPEACASFVAEIDEHWPRAVELDPRLRAGVDELAAQWRERAAELCVEGLAPPPTADERRCMTTYLASLDGLLDAPPRADWTTEVLEWLTPSSSYCELTRIGLDDEVQRALMRARIDSVSGRRREAEATLASAEQRVAQLPAPTHEQAELDLVRLELLARVGSDAEVRAAHARADASTRGSAEARTDLVLMWARYLGLHGAPSEKHTAEHLYYVGFGRLDEHPQGLREAVVDETRGQVERGLGRLDAAVVAFRAAAVVYGELDRPAHAKRALQNAGAVAQEQGAHAEARRLYELILSDVDVDDPSDAVLHARFELADVLRAQASLLSESDCAPALEQLERVVAHGRPQLRLRALGRGAQIIGELGCEDVPLDPWVERADASLNDAEDAQVRAHVEYLVALLLLYREDPRGEPRVLELLRRTDFRASDSFEGLRASWFDWLIEHARCDELRVWQADPATPPEFRTLDCPRPEPTETP
jgi:serine/threonine protein kinase